MPCRKLTYASKLVSRPRASHTAKEWWIVTDRRYFRHPDPQNRLEELHPEKTFEVRRVKAKVRPSNSENAIFQLSKALVELRQAYCRDVESLSRTAASP
jgi:hypothetical protein